MGVSVSCLRGVLHRLVRFQWRSSSASATPDDVRLIGQDEEHAHVGVGNTSSKAEQIIRAAAAAGVASLILSGIGLESLESIGCYSAPRSSALLQVAPHVRMLDLSKNKLETFDLSASVLCGMPLEQLLLHDNSLRGVRMRKDDGNENLGTLALLDLSRNPTLEECPSLSSLTSLSILRADENGWEPEAVLPVLDSLLSLDELSLRGNRLVHGISPGCRLYRTLKWLDLSENGMEVLRIEMDVDAAVSVSLPLRRLYVSGNRLRALPSFAVLQHLTVLRVSKNMLEVVPDDIGQCSRLQWCVLDHNRLVSLPASIGQCGMLRVLSAGNNDISSIPFELRYLAKLQHLDLRHNSLTVLFPNLQMGRWAELETLVLSHNHLTSLPVGLGFLVCLRELRVDHNAIEELPDDMGGLERLEVLDATSNRLGTVPASLADCPRLAVVGLLENPVTVSDLPVDLIARMGKGKGRRKGKGKNKSKLQHVNVLVSKALSKNEMGTGRGRWEWDTVDSDVEADAEVEAEAEADHADSELLRLLESHSDEHGLKPDTSDGELREIRAAWAREMVYPSGSSDHGITSMIIEE